MGMKTTTQIIEHLKSHPYLKKGFSKLKASEITLIEELLNSSEDKDALAIKANRMFMDKSDKPKNWKIISEMASCAISYKFS